MKYRTLNFALSFAILLLAAGPALADYMVIWSADDFDLKTGSNIPLCVGDMVGNGMNVIVGAIGTTTQIRDAMTGAVIMQFDPYEVFGEAYAMVDLDNDGTPECVVSNSSSTKVIDWVIVVGAADQGHPDTVASDFTLHPNPARPGTTLSFTLAKAGAVEVSVYTVAGRRVRRMVEEALPPGRQEIRWDGRDDSGIRLASGTYLVDLSVNKRRIASRKSVLLR